MKLSGFFLSGLMLVLGACDREPQVLANETVPPAPAPPSPPAPDTNKAAHEVEHTSLPEPKGPIDPKSAEAAGQVVQHYGALIEQKRFDEAAKLWGSAEAASQFRLQLKRYPDVHLEIGNLGDSEGAAGSIYMAMPVVFYGKDQKDAAFRRAADVIVRRVNEVPGSTEAQRRWHIYRIEWKDAR